MQILHGRFYYENSLRPDGEGLVDTLCRIVLSLPPDCEIRALLEGVSDDIAVEASTKALTAVLDQSWGFVIATKLLALEAEGVRAFCREHGFQLPSEPLSRFSWSTPATRAVFQPSLARVVKLLIASRASVDGERQSATSRTPFMCCSLGGYSEVALELLAAKADVRCSDVAGHTALDYAIMHHDLDMIKIIAEAHPDLVRLASRCHDRCLPRNLIHGASKLLSVVPEITIMDPEGTRALPGSELYSLVLWKQPLLLRGAGEHLRSAASWRAESLADAVGSDEVKIWDVPYANVYGSAEPPILVPISVFLEDYANVSAPSGLPYYCFVAVNDSSTPKLALFLRETFSLPQHLPVPFDEFRTRVLQFAIGNRGSGSPMHYHYDAMNILLNGRKKWWLVPPANATISRTHPQKYETSMANTFDGRVIEVVQEPGDILYIPDMWGHAVLNLEDLTVAVAIEFQ